MKECNSMANENICIVHCKDCCYSVPSKKEDSSICMVFKSVMSNDFYCKHGNNKEGYVNENY